MRLKNKLYNEALRDKKESVITNDGSCTLYSFEFEEHYHSTTEGALMESLYKHVIPAFSLTKNKQELHILDICFGLGYNTLATLYYVLKNNLALNIHIYSPEFDKKLVQNLKNFNYPDEFKEMKEIINSISEHFYYEDKRFTITVMIGDARIEIPKLTQKIDIVYQDAFSFQKNPLLWTKEYFSSLRDICASDAILTTYSSATNVRMGLWESGWSIYLPNKQNVRIGTIASLGELELEKVDMELKISRNKKAKSLKDSEYI
ncbi:MAG: hypothetical protein IE878_01615 [Epsilonproteobacteria bacterium]|nr:hypothetical protein [Campylobacterota bacterium]MBD3839068.1 hypothetical protein [Campylobacterota bacterium]